MSEPETIHIISNIDNRYVMPLCVALRSAVENLPGPNRLHATILEQSITDENKRRLEASLVGLNVTVMWIDVRLPEDTFTLGSHPGGVAATYLKLFMGEQLPQTVTKVIYLDADVVVCSNLLDLWHTPLDGMILGAVADSRWQCERMARLEIPTADFSQDGSYFNAGIMVIDVTAWRNANVFNQAVWFANRYRDSLYIVDQDLLNCVVGGAYKQLDPSWNLLEFYGTAYRKYWDKIAPAMYPKAALDAANRSPKIVHYSGFPKPWDDPYAAHDPEVFLVYYARTDWGKMSLAIPARSSTLSKQRVYRETIAILKVFYRELELRRIHISLLGDLVIHILKHGSALTYFPRILCRNGYWAVRARAVPRLVARRKRKAAR